MKKLYLILLVFAFFILNLTGCKEDYGKDFIGTWVQVNGNKFPSELTIRFDKGVYHLDLKYFDLKVAEKKLNQETSDYFLGKTKNFPSEENSFNKDSYRVKTLEAVAISNSVLQGDDFSLRLEGKNLKFNEDVYEKK